MNSKRVLKRLTAMLALIAILLLGYQNCGDIRLKSTGQIEKPSVVDPSLPPTPNPTPVPSPSPSPTLPPVITEDGVENVNPIDMTTSIGEVGLTTQAIFVDGYWVIIGQPNVTTGRGGMWVLKENGADVSPGQAALVVDVCAHLTNYARANGFAPPECPRGGSGQIGLFLGGSPYRHLQKISDTDFIVLLARELVRPEDLTNPQRPTCGNGIIFHYRLHKASSTRPIPSVEFVSGIPGCFKNMFLFEDKVVGVGRQRYSDEPLSLYSYNLNTFAPLEATALTVPNQIHVNRYCSTPNSFIMQWVLLTQSSPKIGKHATTSGYEYDDFNETGRCYPSEYEDRSRLLVSEASSRNYHLKLYHETSPGVLQLEQTESFVFPELDPIDQAPHYTRLMTNEMALVAGRFIKVGSRPAVHLERAAGLGGGTGYEQVLISPNGYVLEIYVRSIRMKRLILN